MARRIKEPTEQGKAPLALGVHVSIAGGVDGAWTIARRLRCTAIQIFLKNNRQWSARPYRQEEIAGFHSGRYCPVIAHACYLINLAAPQAVVRERSVCALIDEVQRAALLDVPVIVVHPGAHLGAGEREGLRTCAGSLDEVLGATRDRPVRLALEMTAGQGSALGYRVEHLEELYQRVRWPRRLAVCLDTCHLFAAGYDLRETRRYDELVAELERRVGIEQVVAWHLNDSRGALGSRVDRHAHIGSGELGRAGFRLVVNDARWAGVPMVLETPKGPDLRADRRNLSVIRRLWKRV
ncbi:MAG: deoxyribonuclease IV [Verrucomicrobiae bacterium]|nr:deoxyribonuclease IV [Verrucomicrobiae bacterium]MDW8343984.1 deoxyribonuclease IV [Verrucomicrobiae bacterium]